MSALLDKLASAAGAEFESARTMPPGIYHCEEFLQLEIRDIFKKEWICIGRAAEIPEPGDYFSFDLLDQPVVAIRQDNGGIKVFANVCLHRSAQLLDGCGKTGQIVCPYHAWSYQRDGSLLAAPYMDQAQGFDTVNYQLAEVRWEEWHGFIYVTLDDSATPVSTRLAEFEKIVDHYRVENYVHGFTCEAVWPANWKCFVENYMDAYHIFKVHKNTFGKYGSAEEATSLYDGDEHHTYHLIDIGQLDYERTDVAVGIAHPDNQHMDEFWRRQTLLACVFPAHTMQLQPDMLWYVTVQPQGVDQFRMRWSVSFPPEILADQPDTRNFIENNREFLTAVNAEDEGIIGEVYRGLKSSHSIPGPYAHLERNVFRFGQYISRAISSTWQGQAN